jgi:hypothetical protein
MKYKATQCGMIGRPHHLMRGGNLVDYWIGLLGNTFGDIGKKIGDFVNDNQDLFFSLLVFPLHFNAGLKTHPNPPEAITLPPLIDFVFVLYLFLFLYFIVI